MTIAEEVTRWKFDRATCDDDCDCGMLTDENGNWVRFDDLSQFEPKESVAAAGGNPELEQRIAELERVVQKLALQIECGNTDHDNLIYDAQVVMGEGGEE